MVGGVACGTSRSPTPVGSGPADASPGGPIDGSPVLADAAGGGGRDAAGDASSPPPPDSGAGDGAGDAGGDAGPVSPGSRIKHVVVIVKENHTFDNFFGTFPGANGSPVDSNGVPQCPTGAVSNGQLQMQPCLEAPDVVGHDLCHAHSCALADWDQGKLDGWSTDAGSDNGGVGDGDGMVYRQYFQNDIPNYWALATQYVLGDNFFANMLGPSFPGHMFTVAAQAGWAIDNPPIDLTGNPFRLEAGESLSPYWGCDEFQGGSVTVGGVDLYTFGPDTVDVLSDAGSTPSPDGGAATSAVFPCFSIKAIPDILPAGVTWGFFGTDWSELADTTSVGNINYPVVHEPWGMLDAVNHLRNGPAWATNFFITGAPWDANNPVQSAIASGSLPDVTWIVDQDEFSEHPDLNINQFASWINFPFGGICDGENWTAGYVQMVMNSPYWQDTAIIITWDDFGGWYDHVPPPRQYGGVPGAPYGLGMRIPLLIVSPYARPGFIFHEQAEQASIARFIEKVFGSTNTLSDFDPAAQDGQANDLLDAFDFGQAPLAPISLPMRDCQADGGS
jgi:phospholipase C